MSFTPHSFLPPVATGICAQNAGCPDRKSFAVTAPGAKDNTSASSTHLDVIGITITIIIIIINHVIDISNV